MRKQLSEDQEPVKLYKSRFDEIQELNGNTQRSTFLSNHAKREERLRLSTSIGSLSPQMKFFIRNGQVLLADNINNGSFHVNEESKQLYVFILPISTTHRLMADINFNLYLTKGSQPQKSVPVLDIYGNKVKLGGYRITSWVISNQGRYLCLLVRGILSDSFLIVDLANFMVTEKTLPIRGIVGIVWAGDDRYLGLYSETQVTVFEMQLGDYLILNLTEPIKQIEFSSDKLYIITMSLQMFIYRKAQWVQKENPNFISRWLFPHQQNNTSRVQFYPLSKQKIELKQIDEQAFVRFIKVNDQIQNLLIYADGKIWKCSQLDDQIRVEQIQDNYYQQLQKKDVENYRVKDMRVQVLAQDEKSSKIQVNVVRLHEIGNSNMFIHDQVLYI